MYSASAQSATADKQSSDEKKDKGSDKDKKDKDEPIEGEFEEGSKK